MRSNSWTGTEGLPVSSLNCDRPLHSGIRVPETVMNTGRQITDSVYGAVITKKSLSECSQFIWWMQSSGKWWPTLRPSHLTWAVSLFVGCYRLHSP